MNLPLSGYWHNNAISTLGMNLELFHFFSLLMLVFLICSIMYIFNFFTNGGFSSRKTWNISVQSMESLWTIFPIIFLTIMVGPSLSLLYISDEKSKQFLVLKCIGHQWYWSYESPFESSFDSYMTTKIPNYMDTDNSPTLPAFCPISYACTSADVLHSWTIPVLGIKMDAVPGRLNSNEITTLSSGVFYGQCSEICGVNHSFMPIRVEYC